MKVSVQQLKEKFKQGATPTWEDFANVFDSFVHIDNQAAVNSTIVDQKLNQYAQSQQSGNADGKINTVGDLYSVFIGFDDAPGAVKARILDLLSWDKLPGRPTKLNLNWGEQIIVTDTSQFDPQPTQTPTPASQSTNPATTWLARGLGHLTGQYFIRDIQIRRQWTSNPNAYMDIIVAVVVAIQPSATT